MEHTDTYLTVEGQEIPLSGLDASERKLLARLRSYAAERPPWHEFSNFWLREVVGLYDARKFPRRKTTQTPLYRIAFDLGSRIAIATGKMRLSDYRDDLATIIRERFKTRRAFCKATGISEDMLSHVLAGRKDLAIETLTKALDRIGYRLQITPVPDPILETKRPAARKRAS